MTEHHDWENLEDTPLPEDEGEAMLAVQIGMTFLRAIKETESMQLFSGVPCLTKTCLKRPDGRKWLIAMWEER